MSVFIGQRNRGRAMAAKEAGDKVCHCVFLIFIRYVEMGEQVENEKMVNRNV